MSIEVNELERKDNELALRRIEGKTQYIEINERSLESIYRRIERTQKRSLSVVDFSPEGEELFKELYCGFCWDHGFKCPLGLRVLQQDNKGPRTMKTIYSVINAVTLYLHMKQQAHHKLKIVLKL
jgi:hypothetical protein